MSSNNIRTFCVSRLGASHVKSGKPCQDSSGEWHDEERGIYIAVSADGHGGSTYVRSDRGSQLAVQITLRRLREAIDNPATAPLLRGGKGAVTARPDGPRRLPKNPADWSESQHDLVKQDQAFARQIKTLHRQDDFFQSLFSDIYNDWMADITRDSEEVPFTQEEKTLLGGSRIAKAYGTTLLAFARTPDYWMAFHLGDGKMLAADATGMWTEPVPWDCNCFLNFTTSMCNTNPLPSFRWAYDGTGHFPTAVILGSDGMDDSWGTMEKLKNFYTKILSIFNSDHQEGTPLEQTVADLGEYLTKLSAQGSRDDMTMAGIIDMEGLDLLCKIAQLRQQGNKLREEHDERNKALAEEQKTAEKQIASLRTEMEHKVEEYRKSLLADVERYRLHLEEEAQQQEAELRHAIENRRQEVDELNATSKQHYEELRQQAAQLKAKAQEHEEEMARKNRSLQAKETTTVTPGTGVPTQANNIPQPEAANIAAENTVETEAPVVAGIPVVPVENVEPVEPSAPAEAFVPEEPLDNEEPYEPFRPDDPFAPETPGEPVHHEPVPPVIEEESNEIPVTIAQPQQKSQARQIPIE